MFPDALIEQAEILLERCRQRKLRLAIAESCTGGLVGGCLTAIPGSSDVVERGFVTYSNQAKTELLDVPADLLARRGAVTAEVAEAMAAGALAHSPADLSVSVTGISGPGGGSPSKPVGTVFMGIARRGSTPVAHHFRFDGDRAAVRLATVAQALDLLDRAVAAEVP